MKEFNRDWRVDLDEPNSEENKVTDAEITAYLKK